MLGILLRAHSELSQTDLDHKKKILRLRSNGKFLDAELEESAYYRTTRVLLGSIWMWTGTLINGPNDETLARVRYVVSQCSVFYDLWHDGIGSIESLGPLIAPMNKALKVLYCFWLPKQPVDSGCTDLAIKGAEAYVAQNYGFLLYAGFVGGSRWQHALEELLPWPDEVVSWCHPSQMLFDLLRADNLLSSEQQIYADGLNTLMPEWMDRNEFMENVAHAY